MTELDFLKDENQKLKIQVDDLKKVVKSFEDILKLHEKEIENGEAIIAMYEHIMEFSRTEHRNEVETRKAQEIVSELGREELENAFSRIRELERQNQDLKKQKKESR